MLLKREGGIMPGILYKHMVEMLINHRDEMTHLISRKDYNLLCSYVRMDKEKAKQLLKELQEQGCIKYSVNGRKSNFIEVLDEAKR